jgi:hypothetical protein
MRSRVRRYTSNDSHCERPDPHRGPTRSHSEAISHHGEREIASGQKTALAMTRNGREVVKVA